MCRHVQGKAEVAGTMGYHQSAREGVIRSRQDTRKEQQDTGETSGHRKHGRTHTKTQMGAEKASYFCVEKAYIVNRV